MIATHNIKVNDRWIRAGERYGEESMEETYAPALTGKVENAPEPEKPEIQEIKEEPKPKTATRRKSAR